MPQKYHRGDIYYANLEPHLGCEQGGIRPVLVVQNDVGNKHSKTIIVSALTSRTATKAKLPTHVFLDHIPGMYARIATQKTTMLMNRRNAYGYRSSKRAKRLFPDDTDMERCLWKAAE